MADGARDIGVSDQVKVAQQYAHGAFLGVFKVRWIVQESPIDHRVEGSSLYQNLLPVNSAKIYRLRKH